MFHNRNVYLEIILASFILFTFSTCFLTAQEVPKVDDGLIFFLDGKTQIEIGEKDIYHIFSKQNRFVYIKHQKQQNYWEYTFEFFDFYGKKIAQPDSITGEMRFIFVETEGRILAGQIAFLTRQNKSFLYDLDGKLINILSHDYDTKQIGITEDERYFWFAANKMRPLEPGEKPFLPKWTHTPYNHILVFDVLTGKFLMEYSTSETNFSIFIDGKKYIIPVTLPDIPG